MVAREVHSLEVVGSTPTPATNLVLRQAAWGLSFRTVLRLFFFETRMSKEAIITSSRLNCYGTRVLTEGVDTEQYEKNPILLYMHRRGSRSDMPIGVIENLRREGDFIYGTPKFDELTEEEITRQIEDFHAHGIAGFVIHPRKGLTEEYRYLSENFMNSVAFAVEEAEKLGIAAHAVCLITKTDA